MGERVQLARRRDPYPWTWEPFALWALMLGLVLLLGVQAGRGIANAIAGAGLTWPPANNVVTSIYAIIGGDPAAGLSRPAAAGRLAGPGLLGWMLLLTEAALVAAYTAATLAVLRTWGPWRVLGMATREEAERLLGRTRLRKTAAVVRPDLYDHNQPGARTVVYRDADAEGDPLGHGLSPRFLPTRRHRHRTEPHATAEGTTAEGTGR